MEIRTAYSTGERRPGRTFGMGKTQAHFASECNVNNIMQKYRQTGLMPRPNGNPFYGDFRGVEFQRAQMMVQEAMDSFNDLPSHIRKKFHHDPVQLMEFLENPDNNEEAVRLGLRAKVPEVVKEEHKVEPPKEPVATPAP